MHRIVTCIAQTQVSICSVFGHCIRVLGFNIISSFSRLPSLRRIGGLG